MIGSGAAGRSAEPATLPWELLALTRYRVPAARQRQPVGRQTIADLASDLGRPVRVAVARFDGIGDWVLTVPLFPALRRDRNVGPVTAVGPPGLRALLDRGGIDRFIPYDGGTILSPPSPGGATGKVRAVSWLVGQKAYRAGVGSAHEVDMVLLPRWDTDLGQNARLWAFGASVNVVGFDPRYVRGTSRIERREGALLSNAVPEPSGAVHELDHLRTFGEAVGLDSSASPGYGLEFFGVNRAAPSDRGEPEYVVIHPLSNEPKRQWPLDRWGAVIDELLASTDLHVAVIGSRSEWEQIQTLVERDDARIHNHAGGALGALPQLMASARLFIGNDSGPMHVAASVGTPVVMVSPHPRDGAADHRNSPVRFGPARTDFEILQPDSGLDTCTTGCVARVPHCITAVSVLAVLTAATKLISRGDPPER